MYKIKSKNPISHLCPLKPLVIPVLHVLKNT